MTPFKLSFFVGLFLAMPVVLYQLWAFVAPGLYRHEKRFAVPLLVSSVLLFYVGVAFAYFFVFPVMFEFFVSATPNGVKMHDRHQQLHGFRADDVPVLRLRVRGAGGRRAAGADRHGHRSRSSPRRAATC